MCTVILVVGGKNGGNRMHIHGGYIDQQFWLISPSEGGGEKATSKPSTNINQRGMEIKVNIFFVSGRCGTNAAQRWLCVSKREARNQRLASCNCTKEQRFIHHSQGIRNKPCALTSTKATRHANLVSPAQVGSGAGCIRGSLSHWGPVMEYCRWRT